MKLILLFLSVCVFQLAAKDLAAQKVTLTQQHATIEAAFQVIKAQTGYDVLCKLEHLRKARPISVKLNNAPLSEAMNAILKGQNLEYTINDKTIVVRAKPTADALASKRNAVSHLVLAFPEVRGRVVDSLGNPLPGASVRVLNADGKRTTLQKTTDRDGRFLLQNVPESAFLEISYIGYITQRVPVVAHVGEIVLKLVAADLDEVVVNAGYYIVNERERTGSISRVSGADLELQPIVSPMEALQGRMAGVEIDQFSGMPGSAPKIRVRGTNSLRTEGNYPLYIIDGVPISSEPLDDYTSGGGESYLIASGIGIDPLSTLNLSDIESIEVLKDADATAIYGSRGANGVVLITTKRARVGAQKTQVQARWYSGAGQVERREKLLNSQQYIAFRKAYLNNSGYDEDHPFYSSRALDLLHWDTTRYTDWQDELIGGTAQFSNLNISASGGSDHTSFRLTGGYSDQGTVFPVDISYKKLTVGAKINHISENKKWNLQFSGNYGADKTRSTPTADIIKAIYSAPIAPKLYNADGSLHWEGWEKVGGSSTFASFYNPLRSKYKMTDGDVNNLISNLMISYHILKGLTFRTSMGYTINRRDAVTKKSLLNFVPSQRGVGTNQAVTSIVHAKRTSWIVEPQLTYERDLSHGKLDILLGSTFQSNENTATSAYGRGFVDESLSGDLAAADFKFSSGGRIEEYKYQAIFGRIGYNWQQKFYLNLTGRRDGSSRFGPGKRFSNFGAVGAAWIFTEESLFTDNFSWLSFGKLRGSYGITGSDQIGDYQYIDSYQATTAPGGLYPTQLYNENFAWEKNKKVEAALELGFMEDRIHMGLSWYRNRSSNQLVGYALPLMTGFSSVQSNLPATVQNTGWEVEFSATPVANSDFRWESFLNFSLPKNELIDFPGIELTPYASRYRIGEPLDIYFLYEYIGKNEAGQFTFTDIDGNGRLDFTDRILVQNQSRKYFGGFRNSFSYKQWKLDIQLDFVKRQASRPSSLFNSLPASTTRNYALEQYEMWERGEFEPDNTSSSQYSYFLESSYKTVDGSYLRVKNVSLRFSMPKSWIQSIGIQSGSLFVTGQNLLTLSSYPGLNVESGYGMVIQPPLRILSAGLQLTF